MRVSSKVRMVISAVALSAFATSCVPTPPAPTPDAPAPRAVLSPTAGPAGTTIEVAPPNGDCLKGEYSSLQATLTMRNGLVVTSAYQYIAPPSFSTYGTPDPVVRLRVPPFAAAGRYFVYLSCFSYLDQYQYSAAPFRVTDTPNL